MFPQIGIRIIISSHIPLAKVRHTVRPNISRSGKHSIPTANIASVGRFNTNYQRETFVTYQKGEWGQMPEKETIYIQLNIKVQNWLKMKVFILKKYRSFEKNRRKPHLKKSWYKVHGSIKVVKHSFSLKLVIGYV